MSHRTEVTQVLDSWSKIPHLVSDSIHGLGDDNLDLRRAPDEWSIRELVHHLVEANVVATSIVVAALGSPGCTYDWSWMQPTESWMSLLDYAAKPVDTSLDTLRAVNAYIVSLIGSDFSTLERDVYLRDSPDAELRRVTVAKVLLQECAHAKEHVEDIEKTLAVHGKSA